ncbi:hypothetical protein PFMALIP_01869 [Plasmodium falciparum MaliPS096_E11]|uniref:Uncharacterized protein n=1 Tax=Plasmodium falciparum MaliPS096_E11 TaxID=1036727 RepID=A0A024WUJ2_PLAFA|nr:hypothetical protein PFMALIP_01869 [Plasmodium falciparum MaliPS096_E11]
MYDNNYQMWEKKDDLLKNNNNSFHSNNIMETYNDHYINKTYDEHSNNKVNINICDDITTTNNDHNEEMLDEKKEFAQIKSAKNIYENMKKNFFLFKTLNEDMNTPIKSLNVKGKMNMQDNCEQDDKVGNLKSDKMTEQNEKCDNISNEKCDNILNDKCDNKKKNDLLRNPLEESRKSSLTSYKNKTPSKNVNSKSQLRITSFFKRIDKKTNENHNMHNSTQKICNDHNNNPNDNIQNDKFYNNIYMNSPINYSVEYSEEDYINSFNDNYSDMKTFQKLKKKTKRNIKNTPQSYSIKDHFAVSLQSQDKNDKLSFTNYNSLEKDIFLNQGEKELQFNHNSINKEKNQNKHLQISSLTNHDNIIMNNHTSNLNTQQNEKQSSNHNTIIIHSNNHQPNFTNENVKSNNVSTEQDTYNKHITVLKSTEKLQNQSIEKNKETSQKINVEYILQNLNYNYQPKNQKINTFDYFKEKENVNHCNPYIDHNL